MSKRIKGITIELGAETRGLDKALSDVNKKSRELTKELRDVDRLLKFNPGNSELLAQRQRLLAQEVENTSEKLKRLRDAQAEVDKQFASGKINQAQYDAFQREIVETQSKLKHFESQLETSKSKLEQIGESATKAGEGFKKVGDKMTSTGKDLSLKVTAPLLAIGAASVKLGMDFEAQMSRVSAISGATADEMDQLTESAKKLGADTSKSASEVAIAMEDMAAMGFNAVDIIGAMPGVISASEASGAELADTASIMAASLNIFGMEATEASRVADILAQTANQSAADINDMGNALKYAGPPAAALGVSLEELSASVGIMTDAGLAGEQAGTTLRGALLRLTAPTSKNQKLMDKMGMTFEDAEGNFVGVAEAVRILDETMEGWTETQKTAHLSQLVGTEAVSGMLALMASGPEKIDAMAESLRNSAGASAEAAAIIMDNLKGATEELGGKLETAALAIYENMEPALESLVAMAQKVVDWFNELSPATQNTIVVLAGLAAAIGPLLVVIGTIVASLGALLTAFGTISGAIAVVTTGAAAATPAIGALAAAFTFITGPIGIAIAAITAVIAAGVLLYKNWDTIKAKTTEIWKAIQTLLSATLETISKKIESVMQAIKVTIDKAWSTIEKVFMTVLKAISKALGLDFDKMKNSIQTVMDTIKQTIDTVWNYIRETFANALRFLKSLVTGDFQGMKDAVKNQMSLIKETIGYIWDDIKTIFTNSVDAVKTALSSGFSTAVDIVLGFGQKFYNAGSNIVSMIADGIKSSISKVTNAISDVVGKVRDFLPFSPAKTGPLKDIDKLNFGGPISDSIEGAEGVILDSMGGVLENLSDMTMSLASPTVKSSEKTKQAALKVLSLLNNAKNQRKVRVAF